MIYAGLIHFNDPNSCKNRLLSILGSYTSAPTLIENSFLTLCYSKQHEEYDEVWENPSTLLLGRIFDKISAKELVRTDFENFSSLSKEEALGKIWGKYVYIKTHPEGPQFEIVLDSTGQLPFFYCTFSNGDILFSSDIEILFKVLSQKPEFNWTYLASYLVHGKNSATFTPFKDVFELPPGCCLKLTKNDQKISPFWDPLASYQASKTRRDSVDILRTTLKPLIEPYKNLCVSLSGGIDSSSLVYCLKNIKNEEQTLQAINYYHSSIQSSNEAVHARAVCQETGIKLIEIDLRDTLPFDPFDKKLAMHPNKPTPGLATLKWSDKISDHIPSDGSSIFLSGHGSDHIFMQPPTKRALSDYILEEGLKGSRKVLKKLAHFYRDSLFSILKENGKSLSSYFFYGRSRKRHPRHKQDEGALWIKERTYQEQSSDYIHPIYDHLPSQILPGKYQQLDTLYKGIASIHGQIHQFHPTYYPFLYEPILEFALSFPTYELFDQGYDRYPLRKAVSDYFKTDTIWRRSKGQTTGVTQLGVKKNLTYILDLCLEGELVKQGFVDKEGLHQAIISMASGDNEHLWSLIHIASVEIFIHDWGCH
ncbi:MAG: hypothetical protein JSS10_04870 [Verrucomicrobia bacterium]|nr:hypothetical protein [Verrucomicrobiota bacterium]